MLRLADGKSDREGRVEVCSNGVFLTVCGKKWGKPDAVVVCKQLGHSEKSKTSSVPYSHSLIGALQIQVSFIYKPALPTQAHLAHKPLKIGILPECSILFCNKHSLLSTVCL